MSQTHAQNEISRGDIGMQNFGAGSLRGGGILIPVEVAAPLQVRGFEVMGGTLTRKKLKESMATLM